MTGRGFEPPKVEIKVGEAVHWNFEVDDASVQSHDNSFASGVQKKTFQFKQVFDKAGEYKYSNDRKPEQAGVVIVKE